MRNPLLSSPSGPCCCPPGTRRDAGEGTARSEPRSVPSACTITGTGHVGGHRGEGRGTAGVARTRDLVSPPPMHWTGRTSSRTAASAVSLRVQERHSKASMREPALTAGMGSGIRRLAGHVQDRGVQGGAGLEPLRGATVHFQRWHSPGCPRRGGAPRGPGAAEGQGREYSVGMQWVREGEVFSPPSAGDPDSARAFRPWVIEEGTGVLRMWYSGHDGMTWRILEAAKKVDEPWKRLGVAVDAGFSGETDDYGVESPCVVITPGGYLMAYGGSDGEVTRLHMATSADGRRWVPQGTFMQRGREDALAATDPCLLISGLQWWLYYSGYARSRRGRRASILGAVSPSGASWDRIGRLRDRHGHLPGRGVLGPAGCGVGSVRSRTGRTLRPRPLRGEVARRVGTYVVRGLADRGRHPRVSNLLRTVPRSVADVRPNLLLRIRRHPAVLVAVSGGVDSFRRRVPPPRAGLSGPRGPP